MNFVEAKFWPDYITTWQIRPYIAGVCARSKRLAYSPTANILQWQHPDRRGAKVNGGGARGRDRAASAASLWRPAGQLKAGRLTGPDQTATQRGSAGSDWLEPERNLRCKHWLQLHGLQCWQRILLRVAHVEQDMLDRLRWRQGEGGKKKSVIYHWCIRWGVTTCLPNGRVSAGCCSFQTVPCEMKILQASPHNRADWSHWTSSRGQTNCGFHLRKNKGRFLFTENTFVLTLCHQLTNLQPC